MSHTEDVRLIFLSALYKVSEECLIIRQKKKPQVPVKEFEMNKLLVLKAILKIVSTLLKPIRELIEWLDK